METKIIIATHGTMAAGLKNSLEIIVGEKKNIEIICAYIDDTNDISEMILRILQNHNYEQQLVVLTDLLGGSVNNEFMKHLQTFKFDLISNINLSILITLSLEAHPVTKERLLEIIEEQSMHPQYCNHLISQEEL